mmetsp:Transcript_17880/g.17951  ORF Transcript_17880/g.17951 Transcript_17880/m.17951 type:complete len:101 (+) Transcript_17880:82-384(+)
MSLTRERSESIEDFHVPLKRKMRDEPTESRGNMLLEMHLVIGEKRRRKKLCIESTPFRRQLFSPYKVDSVQGNADEQENSTNTENRNINVLRENGKQLFL